MTNRAPLSWANIRTWFLPHSPAPTTATRSGSGPVIVMVVPSLEVPALEDQAGQDQQDLRIGDAVSRRGDEVRRLDGQPMHGLPLDVEVIEVRKRIVEFFFFQAEDGIRDLTVTGVQTCALPI